MEDREMEYTCKNHNIAKDCVYFTKGECKRNEECHLKKELKYQQKK